LNQQKNHKKVGRPQLPKGQAKAKIVPVRLAENQAKTFAKAAKRSKQSLSEWIRSALNAAIAG
jgi:predicted HicB family RNase H-like nuclease